MCVIAADTEARETLARGIAEGGFSVAGAFPSVSDAEREVGPCTDCATVIYDPGLAEAPGRRKKTAFKAKVAAPVIYAASLDVSGILSALAEGSAPSYAAGGLSEAAEMRGHRFFVPAEGQCPDADWPQLIPGQDPNETSDPAKDGGIPPPVRSKPDAPTGEQHELSVEDPYVQSACARSFTALRTMPVCRKTCSVCMVSRTASRGRIALLPIHSIYVCEGQGYTSDSSSSEEV